MLRRKWKIILKNIERTTLTELKNSIPSSRKKDMSFHLIFNENNESVWYYNIFTSDNTNEVNEKIIKSTYIAKCLLSIQKFLFQLKIVLNRLQQQYVLLNFAILFDRRSITRFIFIHSVLDLILYIPLYIFITMKVIIKVINIKKKKYRDKL